MLAVFSVPKPFKDHIGIIQCNAIRSWSRLHPAVEILLCGDEPGTEEMASEAHAKYLPSISRNRYGTPLLDSVFAQVEQTADSPLLCYVNADIILLSDFVAAVRRITFGKFLMVGQRWDVDITEPWDFDRTDWERALRMYVAARGNLHPPYGSDYFVFPKCAGLATLPPFAVGRPAWDNWFIYHACRHRIPVVDVTRVVTAIHQNHGYAHVPDQRGDSVEGPEADWNRSLTDSSGHVYTPTDSTHVLTSRWVLPTLGLRRLMLQNRLRVETRLRFLRRHMADES